MASQEPTQPATQPILDQRRLGRNSSGLNESDAADIILLLVPATPAAARIVQRTAKRTPEHVLLYDAEDPYDWPLAGLEEQETIIVDKDGQRVPHPDPVATAIALRLSSASLLRNKYHGFVFGRNQQLSDIVLGHDSGRRISNKHFRIFVHENGFPMIEDTSTNGTLVHNVLLKHGDSRFNSTRILEQGSRITISNPNDTEVIKFTVNIPSRGSFDNQYQENWRLFVSECAVAGEREQVLQRLLQRPYRASMKWDGGEHYNIIGELGKGAFATVYQLATKMDGKLLAAKELEKRRFMKNGQLDKKIDNEMRIMAQLQHPNIVQFIEYYDQGDYLYIIMEFVRHGDLQKYLNEKGPLSEELARPLAQQILNALYYLHRAQITHRDIKPDNILIANTNPFEVKISDFGLSKAVKHEETFLKTFCGTLLYCAPEVFPDFHSKGNKRRRGTRQYNSYSSSVDIWSFGGVLWYALCGQPPFEGKADATGEAMYNNIMETELDVRPLKKRGISKSCIELLTMMLQTDPAKRPTEVQCLNHPWLKTSGTVLADPALQSIREEDESEDAEQQLSQLSLGEILESDNEAEDEANVLSDDEFEMLVDSRQSKRIRTDPLFPRNQLRDYEYVSSADPSFQPDHDMEPYVEEEESFRPLAQPERGRLFGEIGQSALRSSGILNAHANQALSHEDSTSNGRPEDVPNSSRTVSEVKRQTPPRARGIPQLDGGFPSSGLLGAESMVRELNMDSPHSPPSGPHSPNEPATPRTPDVPQPNSLEHSDKHPSQISEPTPKARPPMLNRQISLPKTASLYWDPYDKDTHTLEYASKVSGIDFVRAQLEGTTGGAPAMEDTVRQSDGSNDNKSGDEVSQVSSFAGVSGEFNEPGIKPPPRRLGKLTATPDSFVPSLTLHIDQNSTSWGRTLTNTIVYEDSRDTRIPKRAFVIFWWSSSENIQESVQELSQQGKDWTTLDDLHVGIFTCATSGIAINGKHIRQQDEKGRAIFGHLHTGDIIQVYHDSKSTEYLKFKCEFYAGSGQEPRSAGQSFQILHGAKLPA